MRTTLDIDTTVLVAVKELAQRENKTAGQVVSELLRQVLNTRSNPVRAEKSTDKEHYGFAPFPPRGGVVTNQTINDLREKTGD